MYSNYSSLIYPKIDEINNCLHILLIDNEVSNCDQFLNLSNKQIYPIIYSKTSLKSDLLNLFNENFINIKTLAVCFNSYASENPPIFLDSEPLFLNEELELDYTNNNITYSNNLTFILSLINSFNIQNVDFLVFNSFTCLNWIKYYDILSKKSNTLIGVSTDYIENENYNETLSLSNALSNENQKNLSTHSIESIKKYIDALNLSQLITINSGTYEINTQNNNYVVTFNSDAECYFNYDNIEVNCVIVGPGNGKTTTSSFNSIANESLNITINNVGFGIEQSKQKSGYTSLFYNNETYTALGGHDEISSDMYNIEGIINNEIISLGKITLYFSIDALTTPTTTTTTATTDTISASISNICFSANTPIQCDQGIYPISKINPKFHTIRNKKIVAITKSIAQDKHLVRIGKNAFSLNYPNKDIILTKKHNIYFKGKMIQAQKFINYYDKITLVKYNGEILYNILMEKYDVVNVNNILCETLHPENIISKLYTSYISEDYKNKITIAINDCIKKNDYHSYKKIEQRLNKELEHVKYKIF
jgi:hypothetical protein